MGPASLWRCVCVCLVPVTLFVPPSSVHQDMSVWRLTHCCAPCSYSTTQVAARDGREPVVEAFRQLVGPRDPELGRVLRPNTLRARFGVSRVRNAIHCTDLVEDGDLETTYFFNILQQPASAGGTAAAH